MTKFDRLLSIMINPWMVISYVGFIILSFFYFDQPIAYFFHQLDLRTNLVWLNWITKLGLGALYIVSLFLLALYFRFISHNERFEARAWFLWLCVVVPSVICLFLKVLLGRARPSLLFDDNLYGFYGLQTHAPFWSFPSGHTTTVMGFVFGLCVLFPRYCYAFILAGLMVVVSRILLTHHYLGDVMAATYFSLLEVGFLVYCLRRRNWLKTAYQHLESSTCA